MSWTAKEIRDHKETAARLTAIAGVAFTYLRDHPRVTESETKDLILAEFKKRGLVMDKPAATPIVGFKDHSAEPHYYPVPGARKLAPGTLVLIDIWGRLKGKHMPYADITWMGYCGAKKSGIKVPKETQKVFDTVLAARDAGIAFVRREAQRGHIPTGRDANEAANAA